MILYVLSRVHRAGVKEEIMGQAMSGILILFPNKIKADVIVTISMMDSRRNGQILYRALTLW
jgi:hypothetical protein